MTSRLAAAAIVMAFNCSPAFAQVTFNGPTAYKAGDQITITAVLNTSDPNENGEGEPLQIVSTTGFSATDPFYAVPQGYFFIAPAAGSLSASISGSDGDETGTLTVSIAPSNCSTTAPTPVPTPAGCPVKPLTQAQKDTLARIAFQLGSLGTGTAVVALFCGSATAGTCAIPLGVMAAILAGGSGYAAYVAAVDPSDPNFMVIAQPVIPTFTFLTAQPGVTQAEADGFNALMSNLAQETAYFRVLITSTNRAQGAADAGDALWETNQIQAALNYAGTIGSLFGAEPALLSTFQVALSSTGFNLTLTPSLVLQTEDVYAFSGIPPSDTTGLVQFGFTTAEIDQIRQILQVQDVNIVAGSFPGILTNSPLIAALQQGAQAFVTPVQIAIKTDDDDDRGANQPVRIDLRRMEDITVTILSTPTFNAVASINPRSLTFGRTGNENSLESCDKGREDRGDEHGHDDDLPGLVCHFETKAAAFQVGDTVAILKGLTLLGVQISGQQAIVVSIPEDRDRDRDTKQ
jgi:hypothetical protein